MGFWRWLHTDLGGHLLLAHLTQIAESLMPNPQGQVTYAPNYGYDRVLVLRPVPVGSRIRGRLVLRALRPRGDGH